MIKITAGMVRDLGQIHNLEVKAQEYPLPLEAIKVYLETPKAASGANSMDTFTDESVFYCYVATIQNRKVGAALLHHKGKACIISRVSVHPDFRNMGVGKELMQEIEKNAWKAQLICLRMYIPSYKLDDEYDPDYLGGWLDRQYFKAVGCEDRNFRRYGKLWDAYVFERPL